MNNSTIAPHKLYTGHLAYLEQVLPSCVQEHKQTDPLAEVWLIVPNQLTRLHLRTVLARSLGTIANVRLMTINDLMHKLAAPLILSERWRTLGESVVDPILSEVIALYEGKLEYLRPVAATRGFRRALQRTRQELMLHQIEPNQLNVVPLRERERAAKVRDLILLLSEVNLYFEEHKLHDRALLQRIALRATGAAEIKPLLLYAIFDLPPLTRSVIELATSRVKATALVPWLSGNDDYKYADSLVRWYADLGFSHVSQTEPENKYATISIVTAPKDSAVATEIIRDVLYSEGLTAGNAVVMLPAGAATMTSVLESRCRTSGLAPYIYQAKTLGQSAAGRGFAALVKLLDARYTLTQVVSFLVNTPLVHPYAAMAGEWKRLAQEALIISGESEWGQRLTRTSSSLERRLERLSEHEENESAISVIRRKIECCAALLTFLNDLFSLIQNARTANSWQDAVAILWEYYRTHAEISEEFADLTIQLEQSTLLDELKIRLTPVALTEFLISNLDTPGTRVGSFTSGTPLIAPREQCLGTSFDHVFLPGFNEGIIPGGQRQDPLLLDTDRSDINDALKCALPLSVDGLIRERYVIEMQLRAARSRIHIYVAHADADGRPQLHSAYISELLARQNGNEDVSENIEELLKKPPHRVMPAHPLRGPAISQAISEIEYRLLALGEATVNDSGALSYLLNDRTFRRGLEMERERFYADRSGKYEGLLQDRFVLDNLSQRFAVDQPVSPTALEEYWKCPFRFMAQRLWEGYSPEEIDELNPTTGRERGQLFHTILQRYYRDRLNKPFTTEYFALSDLHTVARAAIRDYARHNPVGPRFSMRMLEREILMALTNHHADMLESAGSMKTRYVEVTFGYNEPPFPQAAEYTERAPHFIRFKGRIDRLDSDDSRTRVIITDYKSGKGPAEKSRGDERRLQLAVYRLLAEGGVQECDVGSRYIYLERDGKRIVTDDTDIKTKLDIALGLHDDMRSGVFVADPANGDPAICKHCTVKIACGAQRHSTKQMDSKSVPGMRTVRPRPDDSLSYDGGDDE